MMIAFEVRKKERCLTMNVAILGLVFTFSAFHEHQVAVRKQLLEGGRLMPLQ